MFSKGLNSGTNINAKASFGDAAGTAVTTTAGEGYINAYGIALGAGATEIGLLSTVPLLIGTLFQPLSLILFAILVADEKLYFYLQYCKL